MLQIGWVDFSKEHRKRVLTVLSFLTQRGAVDELGIGVIRDQLADILFPGTSTIHTRAKYFFIVPWIMRNLEKQNLRPDLYMKKLAEIENKMIGILKASGGEGIIGEISGERLKRKPAEIYWNALRTYGIFRHQGLNMTKYMSVAGQLTKEKITRKQMLKTEDGDYMDDRDAFGMSKLGPSWNIVEPPDNWQKELSIELNYKEAQFLKDRIITAPGSRHSLWAAILKDYSKVANKLDDFMLLEPLVKEMSSKTQADYKLAFNFSRLIHGAHIRYNLIFFRSAEKEEQFGKYEEQWKQWSMDMRAFDFNSWDTEALFYRVELRYGSTKEFIRRWVDFSRKVNNLDLDTVDNLLIKREEFLKGKERSKLHKARELADGYKKSIGIIGLLQYRWPNAHRLLNDMLEGLETQNDKA